MIFEGVNFNDAEIKKMTADDFEARHVGILWKNFDETTRRKMLAEVYGLVTQRARPVRNKKTVN